MNEAVNPHDTVTFVSCKALACTMWGFSAVQMRQLWLFTCLLRWKWDSSVHTTSHGDESSTAILARKSFSVKVLRVWSCGFIAELLESYSGRNSKFTHGMSDTRVGHIKGT
ncbi:hypothetical protein TNCV_4863361 [Trichonephila clavipes]|nr:hypothetical protein TNCV_4863361 [Trichonephila clavipes]